MTKFVVDPSLDKLEISIVHVHIVSQSESRNIFDDNTLSVINRGHYLGNLFSI